MARAPKVQGPTKPRKSAPAEHKPLPVAGYTSQPVSKVDLVNEGKLIEEALMRYIDKVAALAADDKSMDGRFCAAGRTQVQFGMMGVYRSVFNPQRIKLPGDPA